MKQSMKNNSWMEMCKCQEQGGAWNNRQKYDSNAEVAIDRKDNQEYDK